MSGIETTPTPQDLTAYAGNASRYLPHNLPAELVVQIMKFLPDIATLSRLFTAYPTTITSFKESGNKIFASILFNMSPELRNASLDVLAVRSRPPIHPSQITYFIEHHLDADAYDAQLSEGTYSLDALLDLIAVAGSLESLTESFAWQRVLCPSMQTDMPLSPVELHRIRRSLWRFQLCCDLCHPETSVSPQERHNAQSSSSRRNIQHRTSHPITPNNVPTVPHWLHCRGEFHRPEALSRFLPNLCAWEHDELSAIRFHLLQLVNRIQYLRSRGAENQSNQHPLLLHRLIREIDAWDPRNPTDHLLLASFGQKSGHGRGVKRYPAVWGRRREMYAASVPNSRRRFAIRAMQGGMEQWGWCVWDEERLVKRGLIDPVLEGLVEVERSGNNDIGDNHGDDDDGDGEEEEEEEGEEEHGLSNSKKRIQERGERVRRAHWECVGAQYEVIDWCVAALFESYRRMSAERGGGEGIGDR